MPIRNGLIKPLKRNAQMISWFGPPCRTSNLTSVKTAVFSRMYVHRRVAEAFQAVMAAIVEGGDADLIDRGDYGGTYCCRTVRGSTAKSPHSWAVAADLNVHHFQGSDGGEVKLGRNNFHCKRSEIALSLELLAPYFNAWGFSWGGHWNTAYIDPMHYEATELTVKVLEGGLSLDETGFINWIRKGVGIPAIGNEEPETALKVVLLPGSDLIKCAPALEAGTTRCNLRGLAEALGYEVIVEHMDEGKIYLRAKGGD